MGRGGHVEVGLGDERELGGRLRDGRGGSLGGGRVGVR